VWGCCSQGLKHAVKRGSFGGGNTLLFSGQVFTQENSMVACFHLSVTVLGEFGCVLPGSAVTVCWSNDLCLMPVVQKCADFGTVQLHWPGGFRPLVWEQVSLT
jgi:hypothetical protein